MGRDDDGQYVPSEWLLRLDGLDASQAGQTLPNVTPRNAAAVAAGVPSGSAQPEIARVSCAPEAAGPWVVTLAPLGFAGNNNPNFDDPLVGDGQSTFGSGFVPQRVRDAVAIVRWSGGRLGAGAFAVVDWPSAGAQFTVWGAFVSVSLLYFADETNNFQDTADAVSTFSAHITRGYTDRAPRRTVFYGDIALLTASIFSVPAFARRAYISQCFTPAVSTPQPIIVAGLSEPGAVTPAAVMFALDVPATQLLELFATGIPIADGVNFLGIAPSLAAVSPLERVRVVYELGLS